MTLFDYNEKLEFSRTYGLSMDLIDKLASVQLRTMISKYITAENRINCICFIISKRPNIFDRMFETKFVDLDDVFSCIDFFPACLQDLPQEILQSESFQNRLLECIKPEWYDFLPSFLSNNPEIKNKCNRTAKLYSENGVDKNGYNSDWVNEKEELISFFSLKGNFPINSKLDYYRLFKEYIESKLSVANFCRKYGISSEEGFNEFLKRIEAESLEESLKIREAKEDSQKRFFLASKEMAEKIASGEVSLEEFLSNPRINFNSTNIELYFKVLSPTDRNKFSRLIMDYIEQHPYLISVNMMKFLSARNLKPCDNYNAFVRTNLSMPQDRDYIQRCKKQMTKISNLERNWQRDKLYATYIIGNQKYTVDDSIVDQAYMYATENGYHISAISMDHLCKQIVTGQITYSQQVSQAKEEMIASIIALIKEEKSIEDYIALMKSRSVSENESQSFGTKI